MSQKSRPQGFAPTYTPSGAISNSRGTMPQFMCNQVPYNLTAMPASPQFASVPVMYPGQMQGSFSQTVQPGMQRVFVPYQQMPVQPFAGNVREKVPSDHTKHPEEQRKLEKERNFQMQRQRLKQFTISGKKGNLNAENLLDGMFGKSDSKKSPPAAYPQPEQKSIPRSISSLDAATPQMPTTMYKSSVVVVNQDVSTRPFRKPKVEKDPKELENMMLKCSDFSGPQKAKSFHKPAVKEITKANSLSGKTFSSSEKSVDWRRLQGLENIFTVPKSRFPAWCKRDCVPPLYLHILNLVTNKDTSATDTKLLYSILMSSDLQQGTLGEIWEMVNLTSPGCLTEEEMFAALALVAIVQAGHAVKNIAILHQLPVCPIPNLRCFSQEPVESPTATPTASTPPQQDSEQLQPKLLDADAPVRPTTISELQDNVAGNMSSWKPFANTGSEVKDLDDDFDDFKSATPMAVNAPALVDPIPQVNEDDFDDFKQAPLDALPNFQNNPTSFSNPRPNVPSDLMLPEDKYSVFRSLHNDTPDSETCALTHESPVPTTDLIGNRKPLLSGDRDSPQVPDKETEGSLTNNIDVNVSDDNDFGDFLDANSTPVPSPSHTSLQTNIPVIFTADFADFSQLNNIDKQKSDITDDFGDFAAFQEPQPQKLDIGQSNLFACYKDNISLAESQSISSLELGAFDGGGHSGESKSSLSRQGSIPSLDLKVVCMENIESCGDDFGIMQSVEFKPPVSPSPSVETNKSCDGKSMQNFNSFPMHPALNVSLVDKYSVIRSEQVLNEDPHINDWTRCIQSSLYILQTATRIFNQMSCSSVCNEVLSTEEGKNYVKNVIEVYKVVCRVSQACKSYEKKNNKLVELIEEANHAFNTLTVFFSGSSLLNDDVSFDFISGILKPDIDSDEKACGVCLLNVDASNKASCRSEEITKLTYGRRQYHCSCANLWVNCVDPLLPVLTLPQLI